MVKTGLKMAAFVLTAGVAFLAAEGRSEEPKPGPVAAGQSSAVADAKPAPVNPFNGMQEREDVFEFTQKPAVKKEGDKWVITFGSKANCDATIAILDKDGKIVRHLASGVLGKNAPYPFQQHSLTQKVEWDGQDDQGKPAPSGCKVKVGLGLKAVFDKNLAYDPNNLPTGNSDFQMPEFKSGDKYLVGKGAGGELFVLGMPKGGMVGRVYKDGKYVRTFWPPSAKDVEKLAQFKPMRPRDGYRFATTTWGDKVLACGDYGPTGFNGDGRQLPLPDLGKAMFFAAGIEDYKLESRPAAIPAAKMDWPVDDYFSAHYLRMATDRGRDEIYAGWTRMGLFRLDGKTGALDKTWFPNGEFTNVTEVSVGPDGSVYTRIGGGGYGQWVLRMDHAGKVVNFDAEGVPLPHEKWPDTGAQIYCGDGWSKALKGVEPKVLWVGLRNHSNVHERGLYVSPRGYIVAAVAHPDADWAMAHGVPKDAPKKGTQVLESYVVAWDNQGKLLTANAVGDMGNGHGVAMDRDGNIYAAMGGRWPAGQTSYYGIVGEAASQSLWGSYGSLLKFLGGVPFPRGEACYSKEVPAGFAKLSGYRNGPTAIKGALWIWGGLVCQTPDICTCHNTRYDMDYFARHWIPANQLYSVVVLDANGNRIARLGRYGNVDDTDADVKEKKDGLRFVWPRALGVSDTALYVADVGSRRILRAALSYAAEETVAVP